MNEAFRFEDAGVLDLEIQILSVAFLLDSYTNKGNNDLAGTVAKGLGGVLRDAAEQTRRLHKRLAKVEALLDGDTDGD